MDSYALVDRASNPALYTAPILRINKNDAKFLSKIQTKKAQFLFEHDYFIWNEAEMYLRYHDLFASLPNSDVLYENVCKTTRIVFNLIHDVHFANTGSNVAHLKFFEVLDAWGALSEYLKLYDKFPQPFMEWFDSIFQIYQIRDEFGERIAPFEAILRLYLLSGRENRDALDAYALITSSKKHKLTFDRVVELFKYIIVSSEMKHFSYALVPKMQENLLLNTKEKRPEEVLRNYDYETNNIKSANSLNSLYSNLSEWKTKEVPPINQIVRGDKSIYENKLKELKIENERVIQQQQVKTKEQNGSNKSFGNKTVIEVITDNTTSSTQTQSEAYLPDKPPIYDITNFPSSSSTSSSSSSTQNPATIIHNNQPKQARPKTPTAELSSTTTETTSCTMVPEKINNRQETQPDGSPAPKPHRVIVKRAFGNTRHKSLTREAGTLGFHLKDISPPPPPVVVYKDSSNELKSAFNKRYLDEKAKSRDGYESSLMGHGGGKNPNFGPKRLSGSVNELDRAVFGFGPCPSGSGSFKLSEFKREFKRFGSTITTANSVSGSTDIISQALSKSINTLDIITGNMNRNMTGLSSTTSDNLTPTTTSHSGSSRLFAANLSTMNDKNSFSHNDLRAVPFSSDSHEQQRHPLAKILKNKNKIYARMKQQENVPLNHSDSLNNSEQDDVNQANRPSVIESSTSQQPVSSSSFFLHEKSSKANKRTSSASNDRQIHETGFKHEETPSMITMSCKDDITRKITDSGVRKESRLLSLSSSFLSSSNESNNEKSKYHEMIQKQHEIPRPETGMRKQIQFNTSRVPRRQPSGGNYFPISSFSSCESGQNAAKGGRFNLQNQPAKIKTKSSSPKPSSLRMYSPINKMSPSPSGRMSVEPPTSSSTLPAVSTYTSNTVSGNTNTNRRSSTPKTMLTSNLTDEPSSGKGSWLLSSYGSTAGSMTLKPPNELPAGRNKSAAHRPSGKRCVNLNMSVPSNVGREVKKNKTYLKAGGDLKPENDDLEINSEKHLKNKYSVCESLKAGNSYGIASEPIKSIMNAITLSSLDTLNDIDSENSSSEDSDSEELRPPRSPSCPEAESVNAGQGGPAIVRATTSDEDNNEPDFDELIGRQHRFHEEDEDDDVYSDPNKTHPPIDDTLKSHHHQRDLFSHRSRRRKHNHHHHHHSTGGGAQKSSTPLPFPAHYLESASQQQKAIQHLLEQDWSYSQNSNNNTYSYSTTNNNVANMNSMLAAAAISYDTQKIINEIVRKLKPYIIKCVRKEVRGCFDRYQQRKDTASTSAKYADTSLTKIGDF